MTATILIVEDSDLGEQLIEILKMEGYSSILALEAITGLRLVKEYQPDLILTDLTLPEVSGLEFISNIHTDPALTHIPVIVMSVGPDRQDAALAAGADAFLSKPFLNEEFLASIQQALKIGQ